MIVYVLLEPESETFYGVYSTDEIALQFKELYSKKYPEHDYSDLEVWAVEMDNLWANKE